MIHLSPIFFALLPAVTFASGSLLKRKMSLSYEESHRLQMEEAYENIMRRRKMECIMAEYEHSKSSRAIAEGPIGGVIRELTPTDGHAVQSSRLSDDPLAELFDSEVASHFDTLRSCRDTLVSAGLDANPAVCDVARELDRIVDALPQSINSLSLNFHRSNQEEQHRLQQQIDTLQHEVEALQSELTALPNAGRDSVSFRTQSDEGFVSAGRSGNSRSAARQITGQNETLLLGMSPSKSRRIAQTSAGFEHRRALYANLVNANIGANSSTLHSSSRPRSTEHPTPSDSMTAHRLGEGCRPPPGVRRGLQGASAHDGLAMFLAILVEGLATSCRAEMVRLFIVDDKGNYVNAASYPHNFDDVPSLDDIRKGHRRLGRPIRTCIERNIGIVGHLPEGSSPEIAEEPPRDEDEHSTAREVKCYICWPIRRKGNPTVACGAIEVINKVASANARELDKATYSRGAMGAEGADLFNRQLLAENAFSGDDEARVHCAAETVGVLADRYPMRAAEIFAAGPFVKAALEQCQVAAGMDHPHLPPEPYQDQLASLENMMRRVLHSQPELPVYRGHMHTITGQINRIEEASQHFHHNGPRTTSRLPSVVSASRGSPGRSVKAEGHIGSYQWKPPSVLTSVDYNLESLRNMWQQGHEENLSIHEQCRYWSGRARDLSSMTKCFKEAINKLQKLRSIEAVQNYLGGLDLTLRSGDVQGFLQHIADETDIVATAEGVEEEDIPSSRSAKEPEAQPAAPTLASTLLQSRRVHHVDEGPQNARTYTIDVEAKRAQQEDIAKLRAEVNATALWEHLKTLPPNHQVPTAAAAEKMHPTRRAHWEIDQHRRDHEERKRRQANPKLPIPVGLFNVAPPNDPSKYRLSRSVRSSTKSTADIQQ